MPVISLQGINGGAGSTSLCAGLATALHQLGESVLVIDLSPDNMLRLHFNMPFKQTNGWGRAWLEDRSWQDSAMRYQEGLDFIPFGQTSKKEQEHLELLLKKEPDFWQDNLSSLLDARDYRWILIDRPTGPAAFGQAGLLSKHHFITILNGDMNSYIRLHQQALPEGSHFLLNKYKSASRLQRDIHLLLQQELPNLLPFMIHLDEAVAESIADKKTVAEYSLNSLAAQDIMTLANWCLINFSGQS